MKFEWTDTDQELALAEGWGVFDNSDYGMRIERSDARRRFRGDGAAQAYVGYRATMVDGLERKALAYLAFHHAVTDAAEQED